MMQLEWIVNLIYLTVMIVIAILAMYLSVLIIAGKYKAKRRIAVSILLGIIIVLLIPYLAMALDQIPIYIPPYMTQLFQNLSPYVAFFILIFLTYWLMDIEWQKAVLISFLTILFIVITNNVILGLTGYNPLQSPF
ncbi:MAG: hypothetical protein ACTSWR_00350 [Candidatus Helarchaeota archaeon]